jgi:hypothetical protein
MIKILQDFTFGRSLNSGPRNKMTIKMRIVENTPAILEQILVDQKTNGSYILKLKIAYT